MIRHHTRTAIAVVTLTAAIAACHRPKPQTHTITIENFTFAPSELVVAPGDTVVWSNKDFVPHSTTARDHSWDSAAIDGGASWRFVAHTAGRHEYYCVFHPTMKATVVVR